MNTTLLRLLVLPLRVMPALLLVAFAGVVGLLALFFARNGRAYALSLVSMLAGAACIIALGQSKVTLPGTTSHDK